MAISRRQRTLAKGTRGVPVSDNSISVSLSFGDDFAGFKRSTCLTTGPAPARKHVQVTAHPVSFRRLATNIRSFVLLFRPTPPSQPMKRSTHNHAAVSQRRLGQANKLWRSKHTDTVTCTCFGAGREPTVRHVDCRKREKSSPKAPERHIGHEQVHRACLSPEPVGGVIWPIRWLHLLHF